MQIKENSADCQPSVVTIEGSYYINPENLSMFDKKKVQINIRT